MLLEQCKKTSSVGSEMKKISIYSLYWKEIANQYFYRGCLRLTQTGKTQGRGSTQLLRPHTENKSDHV